MKKLLIYQHAGSQNHGCEALIRTIFARIKEDNQNIRIDLASFSAENDRTYGLPEEISYVYEHGVSIKRGNMNWVIVQISKLLHLPALNDRLLTRLPWLNRRDAYDCYIAVGGDNYCYEEGKTFYPYDKRITVLGKKRLLIGCSIEPKDLSDNLIQVLKGFSLITTRESITYQALKQIDGLNHVEMVHDSAFTLPTTILDLPDGFEENNTIGINLSQLVLEYETKENITFTNCCKLIEYIIGHTFYQIALIPHVVWKSSDDRIVLKRLYEKYAQSGRIVLIEDCNCMELKGYIARCAMFIGARTHATIAAYSSNVPTLVVGYSVKARGIARDLFGTEENYVLSVQQLEKDDSLIEAFCWLDGHKAHIRNHLEKTMPAYRNDVYRLGKLVKKEME